MYGGFGCRAIFGFGWHPLDPIVIHETNGFAGTQFVGPGNLHGNLNCNLNGNLHIENARRVS
jgi:hypothetical protein